MTTGSYNLFCPLAMACDLIEPRWTLLILLEMWNGSTRFNELRRGVPGISPSLLSKRLKEMEMQGLVERIEDPAKGTVDYIRTPVAIELEPVLDLLGSWAYRNMKPEVTLKNLNADYLMWTLRRKVNLSAFPQRRVVVRFHLTDLPKDSGCYWLIVRPGAMADLCKTDPKFDVDLYVDAESRALASIWLGYSTWPAEIAADRVFLGGEVLLARRIEQWFVTCGFADQGN